MMSTRDGKSNLSLTLPAVRLGRGKSLAARGLGLLAAALVLSVGCGKLHSPLTKPSAEGASNKSLTARVIGYEETVTLKTTPADFMALMANPASFAPGGMELGLNEASSGGVATLGLTSPFNIKRLGLEIKGQLIFIKADPDKIWLVWDNPYALQIQRWEFVPVKEGIRLTLKVDTEVSSDPKWVPLEGTIEKLNEEVFKELDLMLARMQARFDPSLDPQQLVAKGLRGESYEALLQIYRSETWAQASEDEVQQWLADPANADWYTTVFQMDNPNLSATMNNSAGTVTYTPLEMQVGMLKIPSDCFLVRTEAGKGPLMRAYFVAFGNVSLLDMRQKAERGGVTITGEYRTELPSTMSPMGMDLLVASQGLPQLLEGRILALKNGVENQSRK
jgi:hypothetical protein